jgi:hypothetical protein
LYFLLGCILLLSLDQIEGRRPGQNSVRHALQSIQLPDDAFRVEKRGCYKPVIEAEVFGRADWKNIQVYNDDVVITTRQITFLIDDLRETFNNLEKFLHKLNPNKCSFGVLAGQ